MRPLRDLARHTLVYGLGNVVVSALSFTLIPVYTRYLTTAEFGVLGLFLLLHAVLTLFFDLGLTNSVGRFFFDYRSDPTQQRLDEMVATTQTFLLLYGGLLTVALYLFAPGVSRLLVDDASRAPLVRIVAVTVLLEALAIPPLTLFRVQEQSYLWVAVTTIRVAATLGLNIYFVVVAELGVMGILLGTCITAAAVVVVTASPLIARMRHFAVRASVLGEMLRFGLPFFPVLLGVWVIDFSDRYLLQLLRSPEEVGLYTVAYKFGQVMLVFVTAFGMGWTPLRYRIYERLDARETYARVATAAAAVFATLLVVLSLFGDLVLRLATTPAYFPAGRLIPMVGLAYALYGFHLITTTGMGVTKKTGGLTVVVIGAATFNLVANMVWIPRFGMMGAATTTALAYLLLVWGTLRYSQRHYPIAYDWPRIGWTALAALGVIFLSQAVRPEGLWRGTLLSLLLLAVFLSALVAGGVLRASDARAAHRWMQTGLRSS